jgi:hypothetical protein
MIDRDIPVQTVVERDDYKEILDEVIKALVGDYQEGTSINYTLIYFLGRKVVYSEKRRDTIIYHFKRILNNESNLSPIKRQWVKAICDLSLHKWISKYLQPNGQEN